MSRTRHAGSAMCAILIAGAQGCARPVREHPVIGAFRGASCVHSTTTTDKEARRWAAALVLSSGEKLTVEAVHGPGGTVELLDSASGKRWKVADSGDYVYPSDIREDLSKEQLIVKTEGLAAGLSEETWLFQYDVRSRRLLARVRVEPDVLPQDCAVQIIPGGP
jgi:hypothetical protein